jgi:uncharacterized membrane protein YfcA
LTWQFTITGLFIGALVGLTGMGGGSLMTPLLILVFGFKPTLAVGTDLLHGAVFKSFGAARHRRLGTVHGHLALWMFLGSGPMSLLGVQVANYLEDTYGDGLNNAFAQIIGFALVVGAAGLVARTFIQIGARSDDAPFILARRDKIIAVALGASGGFVVGLTSVGSGTFFGLIMILVFPLTAAKIVGTDIWHAAALLWVAGVSYLIHGNVDLHAMFWLLLGSIPGVLLTSHMTLRIPERTLRLALATTLAVSGVKLLDLPQTNLLMLVTLVAGLVTLGLVERNRLRARVVPSDLTPAPQDR